MLYDLRHRFFWKMINTWHDKGVPEGSDITCGQLTVTRTGTPEQLSATSVPLRGGVFLRESDSDGVFYVGLDDSAQTATGHVVKANNPAWIEVNDLSTLWIDTTINGKTISFMAF